MNGMENICDRNNDACLDEIRRQMELLNEKISRHEIISEKAAISGIRKRISKVNHMRRRALWALPVLSVVCPLLLYSQNMPLWFVLASVVLFLLAWLYHSLMYRRIDNASMTTECLVEACRSARTTLKRNRQWLWFGIPAGVLWIGTYIYLQCRYADDPESVCYLVSGCLVGGVIGAIVGFRKNAEYNAAARDLISDIDALISDE